MILIQKLNDMIDEELEDAEKYIRCAINHKEDNPNLSSCFSRLSTEEINHAMLLHEQVVHLIDMYRKEHGNPPERMQIIYEYVHAKYIERMNDLKIMQAVYKS